MGNWYDSFTIERGPSKAGGFGHKTSSPITQGFRFRSRPHPTTSLIQDPGNALKFLTEGFDDLVSAHTEIIAYPCNLFHLFLDSP